MFINKTALKKDLDVYKKTFAEAYCKQASKDITKMAKDAIQLFYENYTPVTDENGKSKYYNRTEDLLRNSYSLYFHNNGKHIYGGVRISADNMKDYRNSWGSNSVTPAINVVNWTWRAGYHGYKNGNPENAIYTYPPYAMVQQAMGDPNFLSRLEEVGFKAASSKNYTYLHKIL